MLIDAHQHFWRLADPGRDWPPPALAAIHRDFLPGDLLPELDRHDVCATVLVQSQPCEDETRRMLAVAAEHPFVGAVVGWTDLKAPDAPARIDALAAHRTLRGLRPMLQALPDDWMGDARLDPAIRAMAAADLAFDALVQPRHLPALCAFARRWPALRIVLDHAAKPLIASGGDHGWYAWIDRIAGLPNVYCKLSGLLTEAGPRGQPEDLDPYVSHVLRCFGPERVMWGSDWPVLHLAADYGRWLEISRHMLAHLNDAARAGIFGFNACGFYRLDLNA